MLVVGGRRVAVPGVEGKNFLDDPRLALDPRDYRLRDGSWVRGICLHTRMSSRMTVRPGAGPGRGWDELIAGRWGRDDRRASAHIAIDSDGSYACLADLQTVAAFHAGHVNGISVGVELYMEWPSAVVYQATIDAAVLLCDAITLAMGIQRQYARETGMCKRLAAPGAHSMSSPTRMPGGQSGRNFCGVYGHRNLDRWKPHDPDDPVWHALGAAGYEGFLIDRGGDLDAWSERQEALGVLPDGVPGPLTARALARRRSEEARQCGPFNGLWVSRPGDRAAL